MAEILAVEVGLFVDIVATMLTGPASNPTLGCPQKPTILNSVASNSRSFGKLSFCATSWHIFS